MITKQTRDDLWNNFREKIETGELEYISTKDAPKYRKEFWILQDKKCAILKEEILLSEATLDHAHGKITDHVGVNGKGLVRAILHRECNGLEGKVWRYWNRTSIKNKYKLQDVLRNLADYYDMIEQGNLPIEQKYIYPSEKPEEPKELFTAAQYKKIKNYYFKVFPRRKKLPKKTKYLTDDIREYLSTIDEYRKNTK